MIGPLEETTVWNKRKEKVDILFLLRTDKESKYLQHRHNTKIRERALEVRDSHKV